jgi:hypothetical protein
MTVHENKGTTGIRSKHEVMLSASSITEKQGHIR